MAWVPGWPSLTTTATSTLPSPSALTPPPLTTLLEEKGDEIFKDCDAIAIELDLEKDTVKQVLRYARKYNKKSLPQSPI